VTFSQPLPTQKISKRISWQEARHSFTAPLISIYGESEADAMWWRWWEKRTGCTRIDWIVKRQQTISGSLHKRLLHELGQLLELRPLAYVLDDAFFLNRTYVLRSAVLIPRPETEELVEWVLEREMKWAPLRVLDVGCGSGVIACTLGLERPGWRVCGMDIDPQALAVARYNARRLRAAVRIYQRDMHEECWPAWDVVVCNPPYIGTGMEHTLSPGVAQHEPHLALFAPQADPLYYYRLLAHRLRTALCSQIGSVKTIKSLNPAAFGEASPGPGHTRHMGSNFQRQTKTMYLEMPPDSAEAIQSLFQDYKTEIRTDAQGLHRMLRVEGHGE